MYIIFSFVVIVIIYFIYNNQKESYDPILDEIHSRLKIIHPKGNQIKLYKGNKSYTVNKKHIYLCLKDENDNYYNINMLMYVALHELAHVIDDVVDTNHRPEFFKILDNLILKADELDLYDKNFKPFRDYCNHT